MSGRISGTPSIIAPPSRPFPPPHHPHHHEGGKLQQDLVLKASHGKFYMMLFTRPF